MKDKIIFADQLRILAFASVIFVHWFATYFVMPSLVSSITGSADLPIQHSGIYDRMLPFFLPGFNYGPFGVAIFFMISGFVIPFSCEKRSSTSFLKARFLRIYIPYSIALLISLLFVYLTSRYYWHTDYKISLVELITNITLTNSLFGIKSIDIINWSLSIEVKFYIFCCIIIKYIRSGSFKPFVLLGLASVLFNFLHHKTSSELPLELMFITYMSIGVLFNYLMTGRIKKTNFCIMLIIQLFFFSCSMYFSTRSTGFFIEVMSATYGILIFGLCFIFRDKFKEKVYLSRISSITYPVYILHFIIGLGLIKIFINEGVSYLTSVLLSLLLVFFIASIMHIFVEKKSIALGRSL